MAGILGLDVIVNVVINSKREVAGVFVGDYVKAHRMGAKLALETYGTKIPKKISQETDLLVLNCYPLDSDPIQTTKALWAKNHFTNNYTVAINPACDGICYHGLFDQVDYARFVDQKSSQEPIAFTEPKIHSADQLLVCSEHFPVNDFYKKHSGDLLFRQWSTLVEALAKKLPENPKVAVFPCAGIQVPAQEN